MTARMKTLVGLAICLVCFLAGWLVISHLIDFF